MHIRTKMMMAAAVLGAAQLAQAQTVDFNTAGDFGTAASSPNFNFSAGSTPWPFESVGAGIGGSRGLAVANSGGSDVSFTYKASALDFSAIGATMETSIYFQKTTATSTSNSRMFDLGFVGGPTSYLSGTAPLAYVRYRSNGTNSFFLELNNNGSAIGSSSTLALTAGNFYKISLRLTNVDGAVVSYSTWVDDYGTSGTTLVSETPVLNFTGSAGNVLTADSSVYAGFRVRNENSARSVAAFDNFSVTSTPGTIARPPREFIHPGLLNNAQEIEHFAQQAVAGLGLWATGYNKIQQDRDFSGATYLTHVAQPAAQYTAAVHWSQPGVARNLLDDARAAYANALLYKVNGNAAHAAKAGEILNAWSGTMTTILNSANQPFTASDPRQDYMLYTSYSWPAMIWTAELLRNDPSSGWTSANQTAFANLLTNLVRPAAEHSNNNLNNNWAAWRTASKMTSAIYLNDTASFDQALQEYRNQLATYIKPDLTGEMGRDLWHSQMGLAALVVTAEMAFKQGVDLYSHNNHQLLRALEYQLPFIMGDYTNWPSALGTPDPGTQVDGGTVWPMYEMAYNHYHNRLGLSAPNLLAMLNAANATVVPNTDGGGPYRGEDFMRVGYGTLTHAGSPVRYEIVAGFDSQFTLAAQGFAITSPTGTATNVLDPAADQTSNTVLRLYNNSADATTIAGAVNVDEFVSIWLDYRFGGEGTLVLKLDGVTVASVVAPESGAGRDFWAQFRLDGQLSAWGLAAGEHAFSIEYLGGAGRQMWIDNVILTTWENTAAVPEPTSLTVLMLGSALLLRRRR